jgi:hypothetical protein
MHRTPVLSDGADCAARVIPDAAGVGYRKRYSVIDSPGISSVLHSPAAWTKRRASLSVPTMSPQW